MTSIHFRHTRRALCTALLLAGAATVVSAQSYPSRTVRVIVPVSAGGPGDTLVRAVTTRLAERWGQQVIVENKPGANTIIGAETAAKADPDGYTLLFTTEATLVGNPALYSKLSYDPTKAFVPVTQLFTVTFVLAVNRDVPAKTLPEFLALARANPGSLTYASTGNGSATHINSELLNLAAGILVRHIPYKGAGQAFTDLIGGQVSAMLLPEGLAAQWVKDGKIHVLAADRDTPSALLPAVPSYAKAGLPEYKPLTAWGAIVAPAGTPTNIITKLNADITAILNQPGVRAAYTDMGITPVGNSTAEFAQVIKADTAKWAKAVGDSGARIE